MCRGISSSKYALFYQWIATGSLSIFPFLVFCGGEGGGALWIGLDVLLFLEVEVLLALHFCFI